MIPAATDTRARAWRAAGARAAGVAAGRSAVVVVGRDADATAEAGVGLAEELARTRRVALVDLIGDAPVLVATSGTDDPHGILDSFLYGVSLNAIARDVEGIPNLFVLRSGTEAVQREDVIGNERWRRLAGGFAEVGAILVLCTTADAPGLDALVRHAGGAICVGGGVVLAPDTETLATLAIGRAAAPESVPPVEPRRATAQFRAVLEEAMTRLPPPPEPPRSLTPPPPEMGRPTWRAGAPPPAMLGEQPEVRRHDRSSGGRPAFGAVLAGGTAKVPPPRRLIGPLVFAAMTVLGVAVGLWWRQRQAATPVSAPTAVPGATAPAGDSAAGAAAPRPTDAMPVLPSTGEAAPYLVPAPLADTADAAAWAVELVVSNTQEGARLRLADAESALPAGTWAPTLVGPEQAIWYKVIGGAAHTRAGADSLLARLRATRVVGPEAGRVVRAPYAFRLQAGVNSEAVPAMLADFAGRGLPAYALRRPDGLLDVLSGAFETPQQAALHVEALRAAGVEPVLAHRSGRAQ